VIQAQNQSQVIHLVAAPSSRVGLDQCHIGRTIPTLLCAHALKSKLTPPGQVILVGDQTCEVHARLLNLQWDKRLAPPLSRPELLSRTIKDLCKGASRVICWNDELAGLLNGVRCEIDLISTSPKYAPKNINKRAQIRVFEQADADYWQSIERNASIDRLLAPVLDSYAETLQPITRDSIGIQTNSMCVGIIADRPSDIDARELAFLMGLLHASGFTLSGIVPSTSNHMAPARRHHRGLDAQFQFLVSSDPISTLLPVLDAIIHPCFDGSGSSMLIERLCDNADVPVLRLRNSGRDGLSRAPGVAGPIIDQLDELMHSMSSKSVQEPALAQSH
jgi:hypothetical protein